MVSYLKTSTDTATGEVSVLKADKEEPAAVYLRRIGSLNSGDFSFWRPLYKLALKVPPNRQFNVTPFTRKVDGVGTLFVFPMNERVSVPRNRKEEKATAETAKQSVTQAAPAEA